MQHLLPGAWQELPQHLLFPTHLTESDVQAVPLATGYSYPGFPLLQHLLPGAAHALPQQIALGLASVATALTIATGEEMAPIVEARRHAEAREKLAQIEGPRCLESQEGSLFALCTVQGIEDLQF